MHPLTLIIANRNYSSWSLRPWLALKQAKLAFDEVVIPLDAPTTRQSILAHSPSGRVPALSHGPIRVWDSLAICEYLAEIAPNANLWPKDAATRAFARSVSAEMHSGFASLRQHMPMNVRRTPSPTRVDTETHADIARVTAIWGECRERFGSAGPYLFGAFSIADAMFAPVVFRFRGYAVDAGPVGKAYVETMLAHPAMVEWAGLAHEETWSIPKYEAAHA